MALKAVDSTGAVQLLPIQVDPVYRFAGAITAAQGAGSAKDCLLITGSASGVTRLLSAKFRLAGGGTASSAGGNLFEMLRVTAAPTGQTNVSVTATKHDPSDGAPGSTVNITPNTTQTAGTSATVLGATNISLSLLGSGGDKFQNVDAAFPCGPEVSQKPIIIPQSGFITFRLASALPAASVLEFDLMISESAN